MSAPDRSQVVVGLVPDETGFPPWDEETLAARPIGHDTFQLNEAPLFAKQLCNQDIVHAVVFEGRWFIDHVVENNGHSTVRVIGFRHRWTQETHDQLISLASRVGASIRHTVLEDFFVIDVPPFARFDELDVGLAAGQTEGIWDYDVGGLSDGHWLQLQNDK